MILVANLTRFSISVNEQLLREFIMSSTVSVLLRLIFVDHLDADQIGIVCHSEDIHVEVTECLQYVRRSVAR